MAFWYNPSTLKQQRNWLRRLKLAQSRLLIDYTNAIEWDLVMSQMITATFENGVLKPAQQLNLPEHSQVRLSIEPMSASNLTVGELSAFLHTLPKLGDDAESFADDVRAMRAEFPAEVNPRD